MISVGVTITAYTFVVFPLLLAVGHNAAIVFVLPLKAFLVKGLIVFTPCIPPNVLGLIK